MRRFLNSRFDRYNFKHEMASAVVSIIAFSAGAAAVRRIVG